MKNVLGAYSVHIIAMVVREACSPCIPKDGRKAWWRGPLVSPSPGEMEHEGLKASRSHTAESASA